MMDFIKKIMIALSAILIMWGCSDDDETTSGSEEAISLSTEIIQMDKNGGSASVTVTSSGDWRLSGVCDWAHPSTTAGKSGDTVIFTIDANDLEETRSVTFKFFTGSSVAPLLIESDPEFLLELLSDKEISVTNSKTDITIQINTNIEPTITYSEGGEEWVTYNSTTSFAGKTSLSFTVAANATYKNRSTTITLSNPRDENTSVNVDLTQEQTNAIIIDSEEDMLMYDLAARTFTVAVRSNVNYTVSGVDGTSWINTSSTSTPQEGDDGLSTITYTYALDASTITRAVTIKYAYSSLSSEITVVQKDPDVDLLEIPDSYFRSVCESNKWIQVLSGSQCIVLDAGLTATSLNTSSSNMRNCTTLKGIEGFPNLTRISISYCNSLEEFDISGLHNVSSLTLDYCYYVGDYNLGDNPITSFSLRDRYNYYKYVDHITFISSVLEDLDLRLYSSSSSYVNSDKVTYIDVSECPALTTLNADRTNKVTTLYLATGQVIPNLTLNSATSISYK